MKGRGPCRASARRSPHPPAPSRGNSRAGWATSGSTTARPCWGFPPGVRQAARSLPAVTVDRVGFSHAPDTVRSGAITEGQPSVRAADTVGADSRRWDAGKKVGGRKRHVIVDTIGMVLVVLVTAANVQDRDGARPALELLRDLYERVVLVWADGGYAGKLVDWAKDKVHVALEIVKCGDDAKGFVVLPRRWVVERSLSWICQRRRCVRDYERLPEHHEAMVHWSMTILMRRRVARVTAPATPK
ncbi:transposase [Streptomyces cyslabdanicus]|uniref:transposase n=1 Tax=Streptomyces cyslabdanicus TaxID=1470456 RepID=UPI004044CD33